MTWLIFPLHSLFMFNITSEYSRFAMWGVHIQNAAYNHWASILWRIKTLSLYAAVQSRCLLSLTGNRASANRSQPLKQLSRIVSVTTLYSQINSNVFHLYIDLQNNVITLQMQCIYGKPWSTGALSPKRKSEFEIEYLPTNTPSTLRFIGMGWPSHDG